MPRGKKVPKQFKVGEKRLIERRFEEKKNKYLPGQWLNMLVFWRGIASLSVIWISYKIFLPPQLQLYLCPLHVASSWGSGSKEFNVQVSILFFSQFQKKKQLSNQVQNLSSSSCFLWVNRNFFRSGWRNRDKTLTWSSSDLLFHHEKQTGFK